MTDPASPTPGAALRAEIERWQKRGGTWYVGQMAELIEALIAALPAPEGREGEAVNDELGLSIDMLDVDRLRDWARLLLVHGGDITHWGSVPFVASKMQTLATGMEKAIRDIGILRAGAEGRQEPEDRTHSYTWVDWLGEPCAVCRLESNNYLHAGHPRKRAEGRQKPEEHA